MRSPEAAKRSRYAVALIVRAASIVLILTGVAALGYAGYVIHTAQSYQAITNREFDLAPATPAPRFAPPPSEGSMIGRLQIPRIGLQVMVVQGDSPRILRRAVGHLPESTLPGEDGNVAIAGHRDTYFRPLRRIRPGDVISFQTPSNAFQYQVEWTRVVAPTATEVLRSSDARELTLITCFPFDFVGPAPNRFIVRAREISETSR